MEKRDQKTIQITSLPVSIYCGELNQEFTLMLIDLTQQATIS